MWTNWISFVWHYYSWSESRGQDVWTWGGWGCNLYIVLYYILYYTILYFLLLSDSYILKYYFVMIFFTYLCMTNIHNTFFSFSFVFFSLKIINELRKRNIFDSTVIVGCTLNLDKHGASLLGAGADTLWPKPIPPEVFTRVFTLVLATIYHII